MTLSYLLVIIACAFMWVAGLNPTHVKPAPDAPPRWVINPNYMCISFALIITAWLVGGIALGERFFR